ncbi:ABC transporter I family member 20 [Capsicum baccatum]|uniref:ABC transporter I family member 20 n=1 Tax=Capsicum baccatum TaxID=33114 RepID=A0A2G2VNJ2_CAPBA|nr:ABC transporter I family member 20 [Capsicum baccatum]
MHKSSDGQRRRVQICMGLLKPFKMFLQGLGLLKFLIKECEERGATITYATHIFSGLENWPSHIIYMARGKLQLTMPMDKVNEINNLSLMCKNDEEIIVVITHDLGHWKLNHTMYSFIAVQPSDAASGPISPMNVRRSRDDMILMTFFDIVAFVFDIQFG